MMAIALMLITMAQGEGAKSMTECIGYALTHSPQIKIAEEAAASARGQVISTMGDYLPHVGLYNTYTQTENPSLGGRISMPGIRPSLISVEYYDISLQATQAIFSWKMIPSVKASRAALRLAEVQVMGAKNDLISQVSRGFYAVLFSRQGLEISKEAESVARENYDTARALYREGKASSFDVSRAKVQWTNSQTDTLRASNAVKLSLESLRTVMFAQEEPVEIGGELEEKPVSLTLDDALNLAVKNRPELRALNESESLYESQVEVARSSAIPTLNASYNYLLEGRRLTTEWDDYYKTWTFLVSLNIPLFDGLTTLGKVRSAKAVLGQVRSLRNGTEEQFRLEVRSAWLSLQEAHERITAQRENVSTARENLRIARERYGMGLLSFLELKDAELSLTQARTNLAQALYDYSVARSALERAVGGGGNVAPELNPSGETKEGSPR